MLPLIDALLTNFRKGGLEAAKTLLDTDTSYNALNDEDKLRLVQRTINTIRYSVGFLLIERLEISPELHQMISDSLVNPDKLDNTLGAPYNFTLRDLAESLISYEYSEALLKRFPILRNCFDKVILGDSFGNTLFTSAAIHNDIERVKRIYQLDPSQLTKTNLIGYNALDEAIDSQVSAGETIQWLFETMTHTQEGVKQIFQTLSLKPRQLEALTMLLEHPNRVIDQILSQDEANNNDFLRLLIANILASIHSNSPNIADIHFHSPDLRALFAVINRAIDLCSPSPIRSHIAARYYRADELVRLDIQATQQSAPSSTLPFSKIGACLFAQRTQHRHQFKVNAIDEKDSLGFTALHHLMANAPGKMINWLTHFTTNEQTYSAQIRTIAEHVINMLNNHHNIEAAKNTLDKLLDYGALIDMPDKLGNTPLHLAAAWHKREFLVYVIQQGAPLNVRNYEGITPLMYACKRNGADEIAELLARGADPLITDNNGHNILYYLALNKTLTPEQISIMDDALREHMESARQLRM